MTRRTFWQAALAAALLATTGGASYAQGAAGGGGRGPGGGFFGGFGGGGSMGLLRIPEVQKELKLDQAQIDLINGMAEAGRGQRPNFNPQEFQSLSEEERRKRFEAFRADMEKRTQEQDKQIEQVLDAKQNARLKQLKIQRAGTRALTQKEVQDSLKLSADQKQKIADASKAEQDSMGQIFQGFRRGPDQPQPSDEERQAAFQKMQTLRTSTDSKILAVLTDPQKKQFETMKGAPFTFPQPQFGGFGRRRGGQPNN